MKALYILHKQNRLSNLILLAASIVFFAIVYFVILHISYTSNLATAGKTLEGQNRYNITVLEKDPSVEDLHKFNEQLQTNKQMTVYTATPIDMMIGSFSGDVEFAPQKTKQDGDYSPVYGLQINEIAQKMNTIEMDTGRFFTTEEFKNYDGKAILPIILGSSYFTLYDVDEIIKIRVFGQEVNAQIVGFLKSDQNIVTATLSQMSGGHQLIIPAQSYTEVPAESNTFAQQSLLASANSMLVTTASKIEIRDLMVDVSTQSDYWNVSVEGAGGATVNLYNLIIKANPAIVMGLFLIALIGMALLFYKVQPKRNERNESLFRILSDSGMTKKSIMNFVLLEAIVILGIGLLIPVLPFVLISQISILAFILYVVASLIIIVLFLVIIHKKTVIKVGEIDG